MMETRENQEKLLLAHSNKMNSVNAMGSDLIKLQGHIKVSGGHCRYERKSP